MKSLFACYSFWYHFLFNFHFSMVWFNWMHHAPSSRFGFSFFCICSQRYFCNFISAKKIKSNCPYFIQEFFFILILCKMELIQLLAKYILQLFFSFSLFICIKFLSNYSSGRWLDNGQWTLMIKNIWKRDDTLFINFLFIVGSLQLQLFDLNWNEKLKREWQCERKMTRELYKMYGVHAKLRIKNKLQLS